MQQNLQCPEQPNYSDRVSFPFRISRVAFFVPVFPLSVCRVIMVLVEYISRIHRENIQGIPSTETSCIKEKLATKVVFIVNNRFSILNLK